MKNIRWSSFREYLMYERSVKITSSHKSAFRFLVGYFSIHPFTREEFRAMIAYLKEEKHLENSTINKYISFAHHLDHFRGSHVLDDYRRLTCEATGAKLILTDKQMKEIADCYIWGRQSERETNLRMKTAIQTLRFLGLRPDELCRLTWDQDKGTHFELTHTKTHTARIVPIPLPLRTLLDKLTRYSHNFIFGGARGQMKPASLNHEIQLRCAKLGIKQHISAYNFRYSCVTWTFLNGGEGSLPRLSKIFGHSLEVSYRYYQNYNIKMLADALEQSHPGLRHSADIDVLKRILIELVKKLVDMSRYDVSLEIIPKPKKIRKLYIS